MADPKTVGRVDHPPGPGWVSKPASAEAERLGIRTRDGVLIESLKPDARRSVRTGDVLVAVNGNAVHSVEDYRKCGELFDLSASDETVLTVFRNGRLYEIPLAAGAR
jgi:S1-C subfamily serine protease